MSTSSASVSPKPGKRRESHVASQHLGTGCLPRPVPQCDGRSRLRVERAHEGWNPADPHLGQQHRQRGVPREYATVEQRTQEVLRRVHTLGVREADQPSDTRAVGQVPADVGPSREVGRGVADVDDGEHPEAGCRVPHGVPRRVPGRDVTGRAAPHRVQEERARTAGSGVLELGDGDRRVREVEGRDRMEAVGVVGESCSVR